MLGSAKTTRDPALSPVRAGWFAFPLAPALRSTGSAALGSATDRSATDSSASFAGFVATMAGSDFSCPCSVVSAVAAYFVPLRTIARMSCKTGFSGKSPLQAIPIYVAPVRPLM